MKCPICAKEVEGGNPFAPFCSDRCRVQDLANWASGKYVIEGGSAGSADDPQDDD